MKPNSTDAHSLVQRIYWRKNDIPAYRDAVVRLCQLHLRAQDFDAALEDYDEYKELRRRDHSGIHMARAVPRRRGFCSVAPRLANEHCGWNSGGRKGPRGVLHKQAIRPGRRKAGMGASPADKCHLRPEFAPVS